MFSEGTKLSRRQVLHMVFVLGGGTIAAPLLAACQPKVIKETVVVEKVVKETVIVEKVKEVEKVRDVVALRFWHHWSATRHPRLQETVKEFEAEYPHIKVLENLMPQKQVSEKILTAVAAGDAPNVAMFARRRLPAFAGEEALLAIDDYLERDSIDGSKVYLPAEWPTCLWQGKCYALPLTEGNYFFFYAVEPFEKAGLDPDKPPATWVELEECAKKLTTFDGDAIDVIGINVNQRLEFLTPLNGEGTVVSEDGRKLTFDRPEVLEALEWSVRFTDDINKGFKNVNAFYAQTGAWEMHPFLVNMEAMMFNHCYMFCFVRDYAPDLEYRIARFPCGPLGTRPVAINDVCWSYVIPSGVEHLDESWELLKYMCYGDGCKNFMRRILRAPTKIDLVNDPWYEENMPNWKEWKEIVKLSVPALAYPVLEQVRDMQKVEQEKALLHKVTPAEAVQNLQTEGQKLLDEWWETH